MGTILWNIDRLIPPLIRWVQMEWTVGFLSRILIVTNLQLMLPIKIRIVSSVHLHLSKCNMLDLPENILGSADTENYLYFSVITVCIIYFVGKRWSWKSVMFVFLIWCQLFFQANRKTQRWAQDFSGNKDGCCARILPEVKERKEDIFLPRNTLRQTPSGFPEVSSSLKPWKHTPTI